MDNTIELYIACSRGTLHFHSTKDKTRVSVLVKTFSDFAEYEQ